jgi:hypothetical protein
VEGEVDLEVVVRIGLEGRHTLQFGSEQGKRVVGDGGGGLGRQLRLKQQPHLMQFPQQLVNVVLGEPFR